MRGSSEQSKDTQGRLQTLSIRFPKCPNINHPYHSDRALGQAVQLVGTTSSRTTLYVIQVVLRLVVLVAYHSYHVSAMRVVNTVRQWVIQLETIRGWHFIG